MYFPGRYEGTVVKVGGQNIFYLTFYQFNLQLLNIQTYDMWPSIHTFTIGPTNVRVSSEVYISCGNTKQDECERNKGEREPQMNNIKNEKWGDNFKYNKSYEDTAKNFIIY